jgi:hypothetical protein
MGGIMQTVMTKQMNICDEFDLNAFLKRRGGIVVVGLVIHALIIIAHLLAA